MPNPIVFKVEQEAKPTKFEKVNFGKARKDRNLEFETYVIAAPTGEGFHTKKAHLSLNFPGWGNWEIKCDEGKGGQNLGLDSAPSPLGYLSVGIAFCLITHIKGLARKFNIPIDDLRVEQRIKFSSTIDFTNMRPEAINGFNDGMETHVIIKSSAPNEEVAKFMEIAENACLALQTVMNAIPASTTLYINEDTYQAASGFVKK